MPKARRIRLALLSTVLAATVVVGLAPSSGAARPLRSGQIITAVHPSSQWDVEGKGRFDGCRAAPDCLAWVRSGCNKALAGRNPAVLSSIVDVGSLADGRTFRTVDVDPHVLVLEWGVLTIEFWRRDCSQFPGRQQASSYCPGGYWQGCRSTVVIPAGVKWMTVTSSQDNVNVVWALR